MNTETLYQKFSECSHIATDTRKNVENSLFFCLKGDNFDANTFAQTAFEKGAKYIVIDNPQYQHIPNTILVDNTLIALQNLALFHRRKLATPIIAITGTNGKTTTKELVYSVLKQSFKTVCTIGNLNNHIGVPLTLLSIKPDTDIAIVEMGANHPNEIAFLCRIAEPDFGYITNFGKAHLEGFGSIEGVIKTKCELYDFLSANEKMIFFNYDNEIQVEKIGNYPHTFSFSKNENKQSNILVKINQKFPFVSVDFQDLHIQSNLVGEYNVDNIAIAIAIGRYFKLSPEAIKRGIESYIPTNSRSQIIEKQNDNKLLLDAYNANPSSMLVAIDNFAQIEYPNKIVILGDMKELGAESHNEHVAIASYLQKFEWKEVWLVGENFEAVKTHFKHFKTTESVIKHLKNQHFENAFFLIKGSRAMTLEKITEYID